MGVELRGSVGELGRHLVLRTQSNTVVSQVPGNGVAIRPKLTSKLIRGLAEAVQLDQLNQLA